MQGSNIPSWILDRIIEGFPSLFGSKEAWAAFSIGYQFGLIATHEHVDSGESDLTEG